MKLLLFVLFLPYVFGAETICSDGKACPEGTKCCPTYDGNIGCCDEHDSNAITASRARVLEVVPAAPFHSFTNVSETQNSWGICLEDVNCRGTCCGSNCCKFKYGYCCTTICCNLGYQCCGDIKKHGKEWCCSFDEKCASYVADLCLNGGSYFIPSSVMIFVFATIRVWLWKILI